MYIVLVCFGIVTISVLCTVIEIKTEFELICLAVCLGLSLEDLVLEQSIFKSAHNKKTTEGFFFQGLISSLPIPYCANSLLYVDFIHGLPRFGGYDSCLVVTCGVMGLSCSACGRGLCRL